MSDLFEFEPGELEEITSFLDASLLRDTLTLTRTTGLSENESGESIPTVVTLSSPCQVVRASEGSNADDKEVPEGNRAIQLWNIHIPKTFVVLATDKNLTVQGYKYSVVSTIDNYTFEMLSTLICQRIT